MSNRRTNKGYRLNYSGGFGRIHFYSNNNPPRQQGNSHNPQCPCCLRNFRICVTAIARKVGKARREDLSQVEVRLLASQFNKAVSVARSYGANAAMFSFDGYGILVKHDWFTNPSLATVNQGVKIQALGGLA